MPSRTFIECIVTWFVSWPPHLNKMVHVFSEDSKKNPCKYFTTLVRSLSSALPLHTHSLLLNNILVWNSHLQLYGNCGLQLCQCCVLCSPQKLNTTNECIVSSLTGLHTTVEQVCVCAASPANHDVIPFGNICLLCFNINFLNSHYRALSPVLTNSRESIFWGTVHSLVKLILDRCWVLNDFRLLVSLSVMCWELAMDWKAHGSCYGQSTWLDFLSSFAWMSLESALLTM